jgi:hypothetical protein
VGGEDAGAPFYWARGGAGRPSVGEKRAAAVVHHNANGGSHFGRGSVGVVVGSDAGGGGVFRPLRERKRRWEAGCTHTRRRQRWSDRGRRRPSRARVSAKHGEGRRQREVWRFPAKEAASGQGTTDSRPSGLRGQAGPAVTQWGEGERVGRRPRPRRLGQKPELGPIEEIKPF